MDSRLRSLARAAMVTGRGSPEDVAYIAAQVQAGLPKSYVTVSVDLGDISAMDYVNPGVRQMASWDLESMPWYKALHGRLVSKHRPELGRFFPGSDLYGQYLRQLILDLQADIMVPWTFTSRKLIEWGVDNLKRLLLWLRMADQRFAPDLVSSAQQHLAMTRIENLAAVRNKTIEGIRLLDQWLLDEDSVELALLDFSKNYCSLLPTVTQLPRDPAWLVDITCHLLQFALNQADLASDGTLKLRDFDPGMQFDDYLIHSIWLAEDFVQAYLGHYMSGAMAQTVQDLERRNSFRAYRQATMQNLSDILLNRTWERPLL